MEKIKISYGNEQVGVTKTLSKEETKQKILELFSTKEITEVNITYKEEPVQLCTSSNN